MIYAYILLLQSVRHQDSACSNEDDGWLGRQFKEVSRKLIAYKITYITCECVSVLLCVTVEQQADFIAPTNL